MTGVTVAVRCRPDAESSDHDSSVVVNSSEKQVVVSGLRLFTFNNVFKNETQEIIFEDLIKPMIKQVTDGYNACILAYGQTGTGKTYTMGLNSMASANNRGMVFLAIEALIEHHVKIEMSFSEVYKEEIFDLMSDSKKKLHLINFEAQHLTKVHVANVESARAALDFGIKSRRIGANNSNLHSSRSHAIVTLHLTREFGDSVVTSKLHMVDLAGSESTSELAGESRREGLMINMGLLQLSNVLAALSSELEHIPYRNSALTSLLKDSLTTKNFIVLIACISSADVAETVRTLTFASRVSKLKCNPEAGLVIKPKSSTPFKIPYTPRKLGNMTFSTPGKGQRPPLKTLNKTVDSPGNLKGYNIPTSTPLFPHKVPLHAPIFTPVPKTMQQAARATKRRSSSEWDGLNISSSTVVEEPSLLTKFQKGTGPPGLCTMENSCITSLLNKDDNLIQSVRCILRELVREEMRSQTFVDSKTNRTLFEASSPPKLRRSNRLSLLKQNASSPYFATRSDSTVLHQQLDPPCTSSKEKATHVLEPNYNKEEATAEWKNDVSHATLLSLNHSEKPPQKKTSKPAELPRPSVRRSVRLSLIPQQNVPPFAMDSSNFKGKKKKNPPETASSQKEGDAQMTHNRVVLDVLKKGNLRKLQMLPTVGPKTALIIQNDRLLRGPLKTLKDLQNIRGLSKNFSKKFYWANNISIDDEDESQ